MSALPSLPPPSLPPPDSSAVGLREGPEVAQTNLANLARWPELRDLALAQRGVLSRAQLKSRGWTPRRIEHELRVGRWTAVAPRVVALQNATLTRDQLGWLGVLHAGPTSALSHLSACEAAGLRWTEEPLVHVVTARGDLVQPLPGLRFHQSRRPYPDWIQPASAPAALRVEHAALLAAERDKHRRRAVGLLAAHVQQRLTTATRLLGAACEISKLRNGALFRLALGDIAGGAHSFAEIDAGRLCTEAGLCPPDRQRIRLDRGGRRRYLDCEWVLADGRMLVLEIDGSFHMRTEHWWNDMRRERAVVLSGRTVLRCASVEIRLDPSSLVRDLVAAGVPAARPGSSAVSPPGGPGFPLTNRVGGQRLSQASKEPKS